MSLLKYAKPVVVLFWLLAAFNVQVPFAEPWAVRLNGLALIIVLAHVLECCCFIVACKPNRSPGWRVDRYCCSAFSTCARCADGLRG